MNKISKLILCSFVASTSLFANKGVTTVKNSLGHTFVDISKSDTSRLYCKNGVFGKPIYSKDKEFSVVVKEENAFIKLAPVVTTSNGVVTNTKVNDFVRDLYIPCNGKLYSLNLVPKDISSQTIVLLDNEKSFKKVNVKEAQTFEKAKDYVTTLQNLIKLAYKEKTPDGYSLRIVNKVFREFNELKIYHTKQYVGDRFKVDEFQINSNIDGDIYEKMFVPYMKNPLALSLTKLSISKGDKFRLFVVSNAKADKLTYHEKMSNYSKSLKDLKRKQEVAKLNKPRTVLFDKDILDFVEKGAK